MATMYAIPALTSWNTAGGWSATSGGASNGTYPASGDTVIFDANSGPSRTITLPVNSYAANMNTTGAAAMTFSGTLTVFCSYGGTINLTGSTSITSINATGITSSNTTIMYINAPNVTIGSLVLNGCVSFSSSITITGVITMNSLGDSTNGYYPYTLSGNGANVTCGSLYSAVVASASATVDFGYGTWTFTGAVMNSNYVLYLSSVSVVNGSSTVKFSYGAGVTTTPNIFSNFPSNTNVWVANTGTVAAYFNFAFTCYSFRVDPGCTVKFATSGSYTATSWQITGTPAFPITLSSTTAGTQGTLAKAGGGTAYFDYCSLKDLNGSPAGSIVARGSTNAGNVTNITFFKARPNLFTYF